MRAPRHRRRLIGHALNVGTQLHGRDHPSKIGRHRLKPEQQIDAFLVDHLLQLIDFFIICDGVRAKIIIAFKQATESTVECALG